MSGLGRPLSSILAALSAILAAAAAVPRDWQMATDGLTINNETSGRYSNPPAIDSLLAGEVVSPVTGGSPLYTPLPYTGADPEGDQQWEWLAEDVWICEEMKMRYDFMNTPALDLLFDKKRPSPRFGSGSTFAFTDIYFTPETSATSCNLYGCETTISNPVMGWEPVTNRTYSRLVNIDRRNMQRIAPYGDPTPACIWGSVTWQEEFIKPVYGGFEYSAPPGCRPQIVMVGGFDVNEAYMNDVWFYDIWNNSWSTPTVAPHNYTLGARPTYPYPRKFPSVNIYRDDGTVHPFGEMDARVGTFDSNWEGQGMWKFFSQPTDLDNIPPAGRHQSHGEIVGVTMFELFEAYVPRFQ